jgi:hypothetical protein
VGGWVGGWVQGHAGLSGSRQVLDRNHPRDHSINHAGSHLLTKSVSQSVRSRPRPRLTWTSWSLISNLEPSLALTALHLLSTAAEGVKSEE